ncbi:MAG: phage holin family protein [Nocardioides sp.]
MRLVTWLLTNAAALGVATWILGGIRITTAEDTWQSKLPALLIAAFIMGLVSMFVEPVVKFLSLPFIILTIGLFLLVINALMLLLTSWLAAKFEVPFEVTGFWPAFWGGLIITIVTGFIDVLVDDE